MRIHHNALINYYLQFKNYCSSILPFQHSSSYDMWYLGSIITTADLSNHEPVSIHYSFSPWLVDTCPAERSESGKGFTTASSDILKWKLKICITITNKEVYTRAEANLGNPYVMQMCQTTTKISSMNFCVLFALIFVSNFCLNFQVPVELPLCC